jgi:hypothetical protein
MAMAVLIALIADLQSSLNLFIPLFSALTIKEIYIAPNIVFNHPVAVGLFKHSNAFGGFVFWPRQPQNGKCSLSYSCLFLGTSRNE